jgi:DNA-binding transcriptional regulator YdaS (Cro superfamily)
MQNFYNAAMRHDRTPIFYEIFKIYGNASKLAKALGVSKQTVSAWKRVPIQHVLQIAQETQIPLEKIRPDVYGAR